MVARVPDTLREGGSAFPLAEQSHIQGGAWSVSHIAVWNLEIEPRYRAPGMRILDRHTRREYVLEADLASVSQSAADDRIDTQTTTTLVDNADGTFTLTAPSHALAQDITVDWNGISLPAFQLTI